MLTFFLLIKVKCLGEFKIKGIVHPKTVISPTGFTPVTVSNPRNLFGV